MTKNENLKRVVEDCAKGDQGAQMELYRLYSNQLYSTCFRILQNEMEAEEVMHDSFLKVFDNISKYVLIYEKLEYSIRRIAINGSIDVLRKRKKIFVDIETIPDSTTFHDPPDIEQSERMVREVKNAIKSLPDTYRTIITLKLIEELSYEEIAEELNIKEATIRSQFMRGKEKIRVIVAKSLKGIC